METVCQPQSDLQLVIVAITALIVLLQQIFSYFRHQHIMADNRRLLHSVEDKIGEISHVK